MPKYSESQPGTGDGEILPSRTTTSPPPVVLDYGRPPPRVSGLRWVAVFAFAGVVLGIVTILTRVNLVEAGVVHPVVEDVPALHLFLVITTLPGLDAGVLLLALADWDLLYYAGIIMGQAIVWGAIGLAAGTLRRFVRGAGRRI